MSIVNSDLPNPVPDPNEVLPKEWGFVETDATPKPHRVPGDGGRPIPSHLDFQSVINWATRTWPLSSDEARKHSLENSLAMRRDPIVMGALSSRIMPTTQLPWSIVPEDLEDMAQLAAAKKVEKLIRRTPRLQQMLRCLQNAIFYGKYAVQLGYKWSFDCGSRGMQVSSWRPVNGDKIVTRWSGECGVLVSPLYAGAKQITPGGFAHFFDETERQQIILHIHEIEDADFADGMMAGMINGVGIRSTLYWFWYLRSQIMQWMMNYLERLGAGGLTIYYYDQGNPESKDAVIAAAKEQIGDNAIIFPRSTNRDNLGAGIDRIEPSNNGTELLRELVTEYFDSYITRFILGQDLSTKAVPAGTETAELHAITLQRIVTFDARNLADSLTSDFVSVIQRYSCPPEIPQLRWEFNIDSYASQKIIEAAKSVWEMGGSIDETQLKKATGLNEPKPGSPILKQIAPMSPEAMGGVYTNAGEGEENGEEVG